MAAGRIAEVEGGGRMLFCDALSDGRALLHDRVNGDAGGYALSADAVLALGRALVDAGGDDAKPDHGERAVVVASVPVLDTRGARQLLHVVRWGYAIAVHTHSQPTAHAGWTLRVDQGLKLGESLVKATTPARRRRADANSN